MTPREELFGLLNCLVEEQVDEASTTRLNQLLRSNPELVADYSDYMAIHAQFFWDTGLCGAKCTSAEFAGKTFKSSVERVPRRRAMIAAAVTSAALLIAAIGIWLQMANPSAGNNELANTSEDIPPSPDAVPSSKGSDEIVAANEGTELKPLELNNTTGSETKATDPEIVSVENQLAVVDVLDDNFTDANMVLELDALIAASWTEHDVSPSSEASDFEWVRRVYLTYLGRIPTVEECRSFLETNGPRKYAALIDDAVNDPERASHMAVVWTNLLVGRTERRGVNREKLFDYLVDVFQANKPWIATVDELITASGRNDENGATNFLLAHLNNEATPATAVTARLFLGEQISCVQCHDHPFAKGVRQQDYWALNAFFKDTTRISVPIALTESSSRQGMPDIPWKLVDRPRRDRMTYYLTRAGLELAVLPRYDGQTLPAESAENRREVLGELLASDSSRRVARSMVNRMWSHFFGHGFTAQVDDMGPHAAVSHPKVLNLLTEGFVKSGYDVKRLMLWIGNSRAWRLGSEATVANEIDRPEDGETPLFSRVYVRRMTPEQVYESIRVAIRSAAGRPVPDSAEYSRHRREWVGQFAKSYGTDENDESMDFDGTIAQAMVMMNGLEVDDAIRQATDAVIGNGQRRRPNSETLDRVAMAMLTRRPTSSEERVFRVHYTKLAHQMKSGPRSNEMAQRLAIEDMMWAYLNSSEFMLVH